jgi:hypothetical protein
VRSSIVRNIPEIETPTTARAAIATAARIPFTRHFRNRSMSGMSFSFMT